MANRTSPFATGTLAIIKMGDVRVAFAQGFNIQDSVTNAQSYGLGSFGPITNEPMSYNGGTCSFTIERYTDAIIDLHQSIVSGKEIEVIRAGDVHNKIVSSTKKQARDGNSLTFVSGLSPALMLFESTFDIEVYADAGDGNEVLLYTAKDCLIQNMGSNLSIGSKMTERYDVAFIKLIDEAGENITAEQAINLGA
jgi:hypothetical protein